MFDKLPYIKSADDLLDQSIRKSQKVMIHDRNPYYKRKKTTIAQTESLFTTITGELEHYVKAFPSINHLPAFYQQLIDITFDTNQVKKALGAVDWAHNTIQQLYKKQASYLRKTSKETLLLQKKRELLGRTSSILTQINPHLLFLIEVHNFLKTLPTVTDQPTVVIAGAPNVGKSSVLTQLSHAKPQIATYPFTTKEIHVGHLHTTTNHQKITYQLIDTPGLLDRPLEERNKIEQQAIAALTTLADLILFILDPSETCGYTVTQQQRLLKNIQHLFQNTPFIIVENKTDLIDTKTSNQKISCTTEKGINSLKKQLLSTMHELTEHSIGQNQ